MKIEKLTRAMMMVVVLVTLLSAPLAVAAEADDFKSALARAVVQDKPLVIDFYTDW
ncbi:hypothetical protein H8E07_17965 [bacterium]|nr:hypothetical protein [bacterium]